MTARERLIRRVEWSLRRVRSSEGYTDTARQVVEDLAGLFPSEVEAAETIEALRSEVGSLRFREDSARIQLRAHLARSKR